MVYSLKEFSKLAPKPRITVLVLRIFIIFFVTFSIFSFAVLAFENAKEFVPDIKKVGKWISPKEQLAKLTNLDNREGTRSPQSDSLTTPNKTKSAASESGSGDVATNTTKFHQQKSTKVKEEKTVKIQVSPTIRNELSALGEQKEVEPAKPESQRDTVWKEIETVTIDIQIQRSPSYAPTGSLWEKLRDRSLRLRWDNIENNYEYSDNLGLIKNIKIPAMGKVEYQVRHHGELEQEGSFDYNKANHRGIIKILIRNPK